MKKIRPGYHDPKNIIMEGFAGNGLIAEGTTVPVDGSAGYAPGCLFFKRDVSGSLALYSNVGTAASCQFTTTHSQTLTTGAGAGITSGTGTIYKSSVELAGSIYVTRIEIDLTGLGSSTTDLDIIGNGTSPAHIGQITTAQNGTILAIRMTCLETPAGGADDIDLYAATEGTGKFDDAITGLTETALITSGMAWSGGVTTTLATTKGSIDVPTANQYLYLTGGEGGTAATYTAGKFLIELFGY
jgi:hypothetical protein